MAKPSIENYRNVEDYHAALNNYYAETLHSEEWSGYSAVRRWFGQDDTTTTEGMSNGSESHRLAS